MNLDRAALSIGKGGTVGAAALTPNPALKPLQFLIGEWRTRGTHPQVPGTSLCGRTAFSWLEGGAFLIMRTEIDEPQFPDGVAIIGSDDVAATLVMIYFDERGTSRIFDVIVGDQTVSWCRENPEFSQSTSITAKNDDRLVSKGRMSKKGGPWMDDLSQDFTRLR